MKCEVCQHTENFVIRTDQDNGAIRRRRQCSRCGHRWTTFESPENAVTELKKIKAALAPVADLVK